ncbi:hypothetical protein [Acinetobacter soli]|uniref:hypothetical protein n=1 Tax=Acinetobacter soli TaxID=487316 RepID=UPI00148F2DC7|nr:hypothetical protein [Acinetobacter soli]MBV6549942.1 hypothetical protein [Acinetobacter soli]
MQWEGKAGDAFFRKDGLNDHLHVVLFEPKQYPQQGYGKRLCLVRVNITTIHPEAYFDPTCVVKSGEHPFIKHDSYVLYQKMEIDDWQHICNCVNSGTYRAATPVSADLLIRMQNGIANSGDTPRKFKKQLF